MLWRLLILGLLAGFGVVETDHALSQTDSKQGDVAAQGKPQENLQDKPHANSPDKKDKHPDERRNEERQIEGHSEERRSGEGHSEERRGGEGRRGGLIEVLRRQGETLEFMPLLKMPEVRADLGLDEVVYKDKLEKFQADMFKRMDDERRQSAPDVNRGKQFIERMKKENDNFASIFNELTAEQKDRVVGLFVQVRSYRALSNKLVAERVGLSKEQATELNTHIDVIREETMEQSRDRFRRIFSNGGGGDEIEKLFRENQKKIDARIEKKLSEAQRAKFLSLRGKEFGGSIENLMRAVEWSLPRPPDKR